VTERIYRGMGHTINDDEIGRVRRMLEGVAAQAWVERQRRPNTLSAKRP
jgi:hypothetical protein